MKKALILEDHKLMQSVFTSILQEAFAGIEVDIANSLKGSLELACKERYDIALVDLSVPDGSGINLIRYLRTHHEECYTVVVTIFDDDEHLFEALEAGVNGYLLKDQSRERLVSIMNGITRGEPPLSPSIARKLLARFSRKFGMQQENCLSERESDVLTLVAKGLRRGEVATALNISENTVAAHLKSIYKKLNISSRAEASIEAIRLGLISSK